MLHTTKERIQEVIDIYFLAWKTQDIELLPKIFAKDAVYKVKPFGVEEYAGIQAIQGYWSAKTIALQYNPKPSVILQTIGDNNVFIEWETVFGTSDGTTKTVRGMLVLIFEKNYIFELREYYRSKEE